MYYALNDTKNVTEQTSTLKSNLGTKWTEFTKQVKNMMH